MTKKEKFYAVRVEKNPGIYKTWPECKEQTNGFSNAKHQSFNTKFEAYTFLTSDSVFNLEKNHASVKRELDTDIGEEIINERSFAKKARVDDIKVEQ